MISRSDLFQSSKKNFKINQREFDSNNDDNGDYLKFINVKNTYMKINSFQDIPEIPDLDEGNDLADDMSFQVAEAPE